MKNKDIDTLIRLCIRGWITYEELIELIDKLEKENLKEPPTIY